MALQFLTGLNVDGNSSFSGYIDLNKNELQNAVIQNLATAPGSPVEGQVYYDSSVGDKQLYFYNGTSWIPVSGDIQEVIAGDGLTGGGNSGSITLDVGAGTGITVNANDIAITNTGVTADTYGSTTAIPVITVNAQGQITSASEASIQTSFDITDGSTTETVNGGDTITFSGTTNEVEVAVSATDTVTIGLPSDVTIGQDLVVTRNLTVQGTASFQHETNLDVADRFIRLASGSSAGGDGGIVIQQDSAANGEAFAFDSATTRWGVTGSFDASTNTIVPDAFMAAAVLGAGTDPSAAPARYIAKGNLFIGSDEAIWIYS